MTHPRPFASLIFIGAFYFVTGVACIGCLPLLLLPTNAPIRCAVRFYESVIAFLERTLLGLTYTVRGLENLPQKGGCIIAAKHYSVYETLKLHLLFPNPAIVLKQELLRLPLWGWFLARAGAIAIDRAQGRKAIKTIDIAARKVAHQGHPIIIFPQGTRVNVDDTPENKPYRAGVARLQTITGLPIVPLALNTGVFWPRGTWQKRGGEVIFSFGPPIPLGLSRVDLMTLLQSRLEQACTALVQAS